MNVPGDWIQEGVSNPAYQTSRTVWSQYWQVNEETMPQPPDTQSLANVLVLHGEVQSSRGRIEKTEKAEG